MQQFRLGLWAAMLIAAPSLSTELLGLELFASTVSSSAKPSSGVNESSSVDESSHAVQRSAHVESVEPPAQETLASVISPGPASPPRRRTLPEAPHGAQPAWVLAKPTAETQVQKTVEQRGVNPCMAPDPGFGEYTSWERTTTLGQMIVPKDLKLGRRGEFDVFFHFHGHDPARKAWVQAMGGASGAVLVGVDFGVGSGAYQGKFAHSGQFDALLKSVEQRVAARFGKQARARHVGLSAWSAGYGAVSQILRSSVARIDTVVLLDGLHVGYQSGQLEENKLAPFVDFARRAASGDKLMFVSHSSIVPPNYASTTETASYLIWKAGGMPTPAKPRKGDPMGLELIRRYSNGGLHVRGFSGNDTLDHCAHLGLYRDVLKAHVVPRWQ